PSRRPLLVPLLAAGLAAPLLPALLARPASAASPVTALPSATAPVRVQAVAGTTLGHDRLGVRRGDTWVLSDSLDGSAPRTYREQLAGYQPVAGDTDGDGDDSVSLFKDGVWLIRDAERGPARSIRFGQRGDQPVLGDWNGDGVDTIGLFRAGRWYVRDSNLGASRTFGYGLPRDVAVVGDWDGNGTTDVGVRRGTTWYQRDRSSSGPTSRQFAFGNAGDLPVSGDWDHDGKDTPGVFRAGTWYLRRGSFPSPYQTVVLGQAGDRPVVRRTQGLAPGVSHSVYSDPSGPFVAHVATVDLAASSSPETVLSGDRLAGVERTSTMTRRAGAVLGVNGDFFLGSGRPVHLMANDGRLLQSPTTLGRAFSLDAGGTVFRMGYPDVRTTLTTAGATGTVTTDVPRTNAGSASDGSLSAFSAFGGSLEVPQAEQCYASLVPSAGRAVRGGAVDQPVTVTGTRCGGASPVVSGTSTFVSADPFTGGGDLVRSLARGSSATLSTQLGFAGAVDALGGNPLLVVNGSVVGSEVDGRGAFFDRAPRTAVGYTREGQLLIVVVDGRQSGYSVGMTMRELADLMLGLGAVQAINLDGGGSSVMVVNGLLASRPSEAERGVSNALVVLPGGDAGQGDLVGAPAAAAVRTWAGAAAGALSASAYGRAATDPASVGGLADQLLREGVPVSAELRRTAGLFRASR
ncbi:MAG: copper amine oxidase-like protein, partial [Frankiales bacterium]|nr:copper amine oxidase-like protein [Frankiales bacterium]